LTWPTQFQLSETATDAWGRTASDTLIGANGSFPRIGNLPLGESPTILGGTGFTLNQKVPFIDETRIPGYGLADPLPDQVQAAIRMGNGLTPEQQGAFSEYSHYATSVAMAWANKPGALTVRQNPGFSVTKTTLVTGLGVSGSAGSGR
ncbi:MAG: hypothetical protein JST92_11765, partial [Deltaproteobacteria bacterium]|nr:hypothetical protein [Deltaproteobacteria bacterium]